ncbi:16S rRNA (guanine(527)-N(7))-methyltransferase RsmG [Nocardioides sp.]|uniref:16S rRNA (guanine(527)-N(7))-methyltransferase RsmG n=1 Tax=Nocardioides sp. TaxID=35761 RepID=UPI00262746AA|nr:16S rRNA (guanine(527)-N(7))-methyltransferase RsmG [Nocardioides sp.]
MVDDASESPDLSLPPAPEAAGKVVTDDRLPVLQQYAEFLATQGTIRGLIGPREVPRLWDRHLLNCAALEAVLPPSSTVADLGSGAGLPGLVVAIVRPDLHVTLVEPLLRRTTFLQEAVDGLALANVEVIRGRAGLLHGKRQFDVVTSRAVAPLLRLLEWSMPLVAPTGALVAMKGSSVEDELVEAAVELRRFGCAEPEVITLGEGILESTTVALRVAWADPARVSLPTARPAGKAAGGKASGAKRSTKSGKAKQQGEVARERRSDARRSGGRRGGSDGR